MFANSELELVFGGEGTYGSRLWVLTLTAASEARTGVPWLFDRTVDWKGLLVLASFALAFASGFGVVVDASVELDAWGWAALEDENLALRLDIHELRRGLGFVTSRLGVETVGVLLSEPARPRKAGRLEVPVAFGRAGDSADATGAGDEGGDGGDGGGVGFQRRDGRCR